MRISDLNYLETITESSTINGGAASASAFAVSQFDVFETGDGGIVVPFASTSTRTEFIQNVSGDQDRAISESGSFSGGQVLG